MILRTLFSNNKRVTRDDQYLNVYVSSDKITVRVLSPAIRESYENVDYTPYQFDRLLSHDYFKRNVDSTNPEIIFVKDDVEYIITHQSYLLLENVVDWKPYAEVAVCMVDNEEYDATNPKHRRLAAFDRIPRTFFNKKGNASPKTGFFYNHRIETKLNRVIDFVVYKSNLDFTTCPMCISYNQLIYTNVKIDVVEDGATEQGVTNITTWRSSTFRPRFNFEQTNTIQPDQRITINVECFDDTDVVVEDRTFTLECTGGYLPNRRLDIKDGKGSFDFVALGLQRGDVVRVKINDRFFTSRGEHIISVE